MAVHTAQEVALYQDAEQADWYRRNDYRQPKPKGRAKV